MAEVTSNDSLDDDRRLKRTFYARTGVPCYLLIDLHAREAALFTDPGGDDYQATTRVPLGETLHLPEPIGITLDTGRLGEQHETDGTAETARASRTGSI